MSGYGDGWDYDDAAEDTPSPVVTRHVRVAFTSGDGMVWSEFHLEAHSTLDVDIPTGATHVQVTMI